MVMALTIFAGGQRNSKLPGRLASRKATAALVLVLVAGACSPLATFDALAPADPGAKISRDKESVRTLQRTAALGRGRGYSNTTRGKYIVTTQFGMSTIELMRKSAQTLHSI